MNVEQPGYEHAFGALRQFVRRKRNVERCELCSAEVAAEHQHLIEPASRKLLCTCDACAILFSGMGTKYKRVPRRVLMLENFHLSDGQWESLMVPISMAFFFRSTQAGRVVALYPSPAGATESLVTRSRSGTIRRITATHDRAKLRAIAGERY